MWLHACSYGEVKSLQFIMSHLLDTNQAQSKDFAQSKQKDSKDCAQPLPSLSNSMHLPHSQNSPHPPSPTISPHKNLQILLTTITHTGYTLAKETYAGYPNVRVEFLPFEIFLPFYAKRFFIDSSKISCLKLLCVFEAELWLGLFSLAKCLNSHTMLLNARISSRSYPRYKRFSFFYRHIFALVDSVFAQSDEDKSRLESLGAKNIQAIGNLKAYNPPTITKNYDKPKGTLFLAASTHNGEEELIIDAFLSAFGKERFGKKGDIFLAIIPRHPERFGEVAKLIESKNLAFSCLSQGCEKAFCERILLIDTLGELNNFYAIADISILGGSFAKEGGHNPLEPAHFQNVLISGEHIFNQKALFAMVQNAYIIKQDELESTLKNYKNLAKSYIDSTHSNLPQLLESIDKHLA
ncbi:hypothetical protein HMPREF2086_01716 [Helicobacter macacae MIT 99-5501]|uniref:3-deoxy-D-manno-octulosonic acid transferase n=2 Tax=Helicobacter TaxID=209 RepID=V8C7A7_9HELI|nr:hypothetical protein HMPREF2086_01716 [Helicobacter macacae MIT 99-5501]